MQKEFNKVKPYVYWIKNNITGIKYFGVRWANVNKNKTPIQDLGKTYFSSGALKKDFKRNPKNFVSKLIATFDTEEEARDYELKQTKKIIKNKRYANIAAYPAIIMTPEIINKLFTPEHRRKLSITSKGRKFSEETRRKISEGNKGRPAWNSGKTNIYSEETRKKMSEVAKRRKFSEETRRKMSASSKGRKVSEETRRKIGLGHRGKIISKETRRKLRLFNIGRKHSEETKRKMSTASKGKKKSEEHKRKMSEAHKRRFAKN